MSVQPPPEGRPAVLAPATGLGVNRRAFLRGTALAASGAAVSGLVARAPRAWAHQHRGPSSKFGRPEITHGVQAGDVTGGTAVIWARADRPSRMMIEFDTHGSFRRGRRIEGPLATPATDFTAQQLIGPLPPGQRISY